MMMMMTHGSCTETMVDFLIGLALRLPSSSKFLKDFVHYECRTLLAEYRDSNPLLQESLSQSDKWEREFKTLQVALHMQCIMPIIQCFNQRISEFFTNEQEELRSVRESHAEEMRAKNEEIKSLHELAAQLRESRDEMKAFITNRLSQEHLRQRGDQERGEGMLHEHD